MDEFIAQILVHFSLLCSMNLNLIIVINIAGSKRRKNQTEKFRNIIETTSLYLHYINTCISSQWVIEQRWVCELKSMKNSQERHNWINCRTKRAKKSKSFFIRFLEISRFLETPYVRHLSDCVRSPTHIHMRDYTFLRTFINFARHFSFTLVAFDEFQVLCHEPNRNQIEKKFLSFVARRMRTQEINHFSLATNKNNFFFLFISLWSLARSRRW